MDKRTILMLVNDLFFQVRIESALGAAGYSVIDATSGSLADHVHTKRPDLVIVDIGGFGLDWEAAVREIKDADERLPVLAFGSHMDLNARERALEAGADRVVAKSQFVDSLTDLVARYARTPGVTGGGE